MRSATARSKRRRRNWAFRSTPPIGAVNRRSLLCFPDNMTLEYRVEKFWVGDRSTRVGLGRAPHDCAVGLGNRLDDVDATVGGIYPFNLQGSKLSPSDPRVGE